MLFFVPYNLVIVMKDDVSEQINVHPNFLQALIISQHATLEFKVRHPVDIAELRGRFFLIFKKSASSRYKKIVIHRRQKNTRTIRKRVAEFVDRYKGDLPVVHKLNDYFKNLKLGEWFEIVPYAQLADQMQHLKATRLMYALNAGKDFDEIWQEAKDEFGDLMEVYQLSTFDCAEGKKRRLGEPDKKKRVCRFCNNSRIPLSFKNEAHAISEAFGNKKIISNEECDGCNTAFGQGIESELTIYLRVYLMMARIEGKNGIAKKTKGKNFSLAMAESMTIEMSDPVQNEGHFVGELRLVTNEHSTFQNLYRCLCKFAIGVMNRDKLPQFNKTVEWINGKTSKSILPRIAMKIIPHEAYQYPFLAIYELKQDQSNRPKLVAEFRISVLRFLFIVPSFSDEESDFTHENAYCDYWNFFKYYSSSSGWIFNDFSDDVSKQVVYKMTFD